MSQDSLTTLGWVLHKRPVGDSSAYVVFLTQQKGLVKARVQGGRMPKKQSILQPFTPLWLTFDEKKYGHYVRQVEMMAASLVLPKQNIFAALYINELVYYLLRQHEQDDGLYQAYEATLQALTVHESKASIEGVLRRFEWKLLDISGFQVSYVQEVDGVSWIKAQCYYHFIPGSGFTLAQQGFLGEHILAISEGQLYADDVLKTAKQIMRQAIDYALNGAVIRSRALYRII